MGEQVESSVLNERIDRMTADLSEIKIELRRIAGDMERVVRLEERHGTHAQALERAFLRIEAMETRVVKLEVEAPITRLVRGWVISGVIGVVGLLGTQLVAVMWFAAKHMPQ